MLLAFFYFCSCCTGKTSNTQLSAGTSAVVFCNGDRNDVFILFMRILRIYRINDANKTNLRLYLCFSYSWGQRLHPDPHPGTTGAGRQGSPWISRDPGSWIHPTKAANIGQTAHHQGESDQGMTIDSCFKSKFQFFTLELFSALDMGCNYFL